MTDDLDALEALVGQPDVGVSVTVQTRIVRDLIAAARERDEARNKAGEGFLAVLRLTTQRDAARAEVAALRERIEAALDTCGHHDDERHLAAPLCQRCRVLAALVQPADTEEADQ